MKIMCSALVFLVGCSVATAAPLEPRTTARADHVTNAVQCPGGGWCDDPFVCSSLPGKCAAADTAIVGGELVSR